MRTPTTTAGVRRGSAYENSIVGIFAFSGGIAALDNQAAFFVMPFIAPELGFNNIQIGMIGTAALLAWSVSGFIAGPLSDRMGKRKPILIAAFLCFALFSVGSAFANSFATFLLARLLVGLAEGPVIPVEQAIVHAESSPHRVAFNMGLTQNFGAQLMGSFLAPLVLVWIAEHYGWRNAFLFAALPGLIVAVVIALFVREPAPPPAGDLTEKISLRLQLSAILDARNVQLCLAVGSCTVAWYFVQLSFMPLYLTKTLGLSATTMSQVISMFGVAGVIGAALAPALADRYGRKPIIVAFSALAAIAPMGVYFAGANPVLLGMSIFTGCLIIGTIPIFMATVPVESLPARYAATATGLVMGLTQIVGGFAGPIITGALADRMGLGIIIWVSSGLAVAAALIALALRETLGQKAA